MAPKRPDNEPGSAPAGGDPSDPATSFRSSGSKREPSSTAAPVFSPTLRDKGVRDRIRKRQDGQADSFFEVLIKQPYLSPRVGAPPRADDGLPLEEDASEAASSPQASLAPASVGSAIGAPPAARARGFWSRPRARISMVLMAVFLLGLGAGALLMAARTSPVDPTTLATSSTDSASPTAPPGPVMTTGPVPLATSPAVTGLPLAPVAEAPPSRPPQAETARVHDPGSVRSSEATEPRHTRSKIDLGDAGLVIPIPAHDLQLKDEP